MLTKYTITLQPDVPCTPRADWAYRLYAILLNAAPQDFAQAVHANGSTPVSQYLQVQKERLLWHVTVLGAENEAVLCPAVEALERCFLRTINVTLTVTERKKEAVSDPDALFALPGGNHTLCFRTPTAFKSQGHYLNLPTPRLILRNLVQKWNGSLTECPIEDADGEGLEALAAGIWAGNFRIFSRAYRLKGIAVPGFVGTLTLENHLSGFHRQLADALLRFAAYAGVGVKTTLGMGGVAHL